MRLIVLKKKMLFKEIFGFKGVMFLEKVVKLKLNYNQQKINANVLQKAGKRQVAKILGYNVAIKNILIIKLLRIKFSRRSRMGLLNMKGLPLTVPSPFSPARYASPY